MSYSPRRERTASKRLPYKRTKKSYKTTKKTLPKPRKERIIPPEPLEVVSFEFGNPNLKFYKFPPTESAKELALEYKYRPYMIERYLQMFGEQETLELLIANEIPDNPCIRINSIKADEVSVVNTLKLKGYNVAKIEPLLHAYEIIIDSEVTEKKDLKKQNNPIIEKIKKEDIGFTRDAKILEQVEWGKPSREKIKESSIKEIQNKNLIKKNKTKYQIGTLGSTDEYLKGYYYIQSKVSMLPPIFLNPSENETIIDMCAAPGGKTTHLAQLMNNTGKIIATEISNRRIKSLVYNIRRCGIRNTTVLNINANELIHHNIHSNKILLDAPCSGEGLIRNDKTRKQSKSPKDITRNMAIQGNLLKNAFKMVEPGGTIMYSTCSIAPEENEFVIQNLLESNQKAKILDINDDIGSPGFTKIFGVELSYDLIKARRYFPHIHDTIGFFYCLIQKMK